MHILLRTERLILRPLTIDDLASVHDYASDLENTKLMMFLPNETIEETKEFLTKVTDEWNKETPSFYEFGIIRNDILIGSIGIDLNEARTEGELGWILNKAYWRNGYTKEAAMAIKDFAINKLKLKRLFAHCDIANTGSYRVMEAIGLTRISDDQIRYNKSSKTPSYELCYELKVEDII